LRRSLYSECQACGTEVTTPEQARENKADAIAYRRQVDQEAGDV